MTRLVRMAKPSSAERFESESRSSPSEPCHVLIVCLSLLRYHFSRAMSVEDIPEWLFTPAELAARRTRRAPPPPSPSARRRSTFGRRDDNEPSMAAVRAAGRKASRVPLTREGGMSRQNRMDSLDEGPTGSGHRAGSAGEGRAADKLRAMREAKRVR